ncbi:hypothetical protein DCBHLPFO_00755 [Mycoplasmopsis arginini]|uniref:Uncharacterized protein n=1 Tax=Mycoplasmopsis arginini TaxID=2094 RepID=A0AA43TZQ9_MYCAR|nr:hypothetical protein [Mycoplasmopsis arginini]
MFFWPLSDAWGSWKIIWIFLRKNLVLEREILRPLITLPSSVTNPLKSSYKRINERPTVVLPDPDSPINPTISPLFTLKLISSTALLTIPALLKYFLRDWISNIGLLVFIIYKYLSKAF